MSKISKIVLDGDTLDLSTTAENVSYNGNVQDATNIKGAVDSLQNQISDSANSKFVYSAIGDSITTPMAHNSYLSYPSTLASLLNANLQRISAGGTQIRGALKGYASSVNSSAKLVTVLFGINDIYAQTLDDSIQLGDYNTIMGTSLENLANNDTIFGVYRYALETLKSRLNQRAIICCISPLYHRLYDASGGNFYNQNLQTLRQMIRQFVIDNGSSNNGWWYINGLDLISEKESSLVYIYGDNHNVDNIHPNSEGCAMIAHRIFERLPNINLYYNRPSS